ncbi:MAG: hypothetical protein ATN33_05465 [Epulopiscium sp. Nele67-Bin001]|nr:MAG: hypothetical protein ATN33_05465 [Epulopiscium sp. Nele67-Bin001]
MYIFLFIQQPKYYLEVGSEYTRAEIFLEHTSLEFVKDETLKAFGLKSQLAFDFTQYSLGSIKTIDDLRTFQLYYQIMHIDL